MRHDKEVQDALSQLELEKQRNEVKALLDGDSKKADMEEE